MSTLEEIGVLLGFAGFAGVAVLAFLTFQQARRLRRLRDWAGRAPERALAAAEREAAAGAEAAGEDAEDAEDADAAEPPGPGRIAVAAESLKLRYAELDRRMPVDPRVFAAGLLAIVLGVGVATSGFGLAGSGDGQQSAGGGGANGERREAREQRRAERRARPQVAVLNGSAGPDGVGVPGLADRFSGDVRDAGYRIGSVDDTDSVAASVIMFRNGSEEQAEQLAADLAEVLGALPTTVMSPTVELAAGDADLALVIGQSDAGR